MESNTRLPRHESRVGGASPSGRVGDAPCSVTITPKAPDRPASRADTRELVGSGPAFNRLLAEIAAYAPYSVDVRLRGETGTGKTEVAGIVHATSPRRGGPFVRVNCASEPAELFERHFFGSEKGSFTGAAQQHKGYFERAHGGTLFLDEIAELSPAQQAKLLAALDSRTFMRIGGTGALRVDVRVICATNQDLEGLVGRKLFREDLLSRLGGCEIAVPPLRERREDVPMLFDYFLAEWGAKNGCAVTLGVEEGVAEALASYSWPRNVRQLKNLTEGLAIRAAASGVVTLADALSAITAEATRVRCGGDFRPPPFSGDDAAGAVLPTRGAADDVIILPPYRVGTPFDAFVAQVFLVVYGQLVRKWTREQAAGLLHIPLRTLYLRLKTAQKLITN